MSSRRGDGAPGAHDDTVGAPVGTAPTLAPGAAVDTGAATLAPGAAVDTGAATLAAGSVGGAGAALSAADTLAAGTATPVARVVPGGDFDDLLEVPPDRYRIDGELAHGGMGRILIARDRRLGRKVAIKELLVADPGLRRRFEREARITGGLQHPSIINVIEAGRWPSGEPFLAMKLVAGQALDKVIAATSTLPERLALLPRVIAVADALAYAHAERVIHRDLKPANVLVGDFGETVVIDWGLAKRLDGPAGDDDAGEAAPAPARGDGGETIAGAVLGTPAYMPPEQARGEGVDERTDVYAIGAILYHALSGRPPLTGRTLEEVLARSMTAAVEPLDRVVPDVPPDLAAIVRRAMAAEPADRYPTARELAEDLRRYQTGQLVASHRYTPWQLARRWIRRHRAALTVAAVATAVLAVLGVLAVLRILDESAAARAGQARAEAAEQEARANLARALFEKGRQAEAAQRWDEAAILFARSRVEHDDPRAAWRAGLADARLLPAVDAARAPARLGAMAATPDGDHVVVGLHGGEIVERARGGAGWRPLAQAGAPVTALAVSPDGATVYAGDAAGRVLTIDRRAGAVVREADTGSAVLAIDPTPDGAGIATGHEDGAIRTWRRAGDRPDGVLTGHRQRVYALRHAADGTLVSSSDDRTVRWWQGGAPAGELGAHPLGGIKALALSPDGTRFATAGWDWTIKLWRVADRTLIREWKEDDIVNALVFAPDGSWLASGGAARDVSVWDVETGTRIARLGGHGHELVALAASRDGRHVASADRDGEVRWWDVTRAQRVALEIGHIDNVKSLAWTGDLLISAGYDRSFRLWEMPHGRPLGRIASPGASDYLFGVSPAGDALAAGGSDGTVRTWRLPGGEPAGELVTETIASLATSPDGRWHAGGSPSGRVHLIDAASLTTARKIDAHGHVAYGVAWAPDSAALVTVGLDGWLREWTVPAGERVWEHRVEVEPLAAAVSPDGRLVAVVGEEAALTLLDRVDRRVVASLDGHGARIWGVAFSPDGALVATTSEDGTVRLWDPAARAAVAVLDGDPARGSTMGVAFSPAGDRLAVGHADGTIAIWDVAARRLVAELGRGALGGVGACAELDRMPASDPVRADLVRGCTLPPADYQRHAERRTGLTVDGTELRRAPVPAP